MADKTTYLQLNKPGANARGWGSALNSNMDILDSAYNSTNSRINSIQLQLGEMNYISFLEDYQYVKLNEDNDSYFTIGTVSNTGVFTGEKQYGEGAGTSGLTREPYTEIPDFTGFYVVDGVNSYSSAAPYDLNWQAGEILVKTSQIQDNQRIARFVKFPQALGGYYEPQTKQVVGPNYEVKFNKVMPLDAPETVTITMPAGTVNGTWKNIQLSSSSFVSTSSTSGAYQWRYQITEVTATSTTYIPPVDVRFFEVANSKVQRIEIDYWFQNSGSTCYLYIELAENVRTNLWCSYIIYKT